MMVLLQQVFTIILALIGISFLIFIHELGHFFLAKKMKMKIEVFSIGMGKPIFSWKRKNIRWQVCWFPVGGYVKIAGMEKEGKKEPHEIANGFYSKKPWRRIVVALAGPGANFLFSLVAFSLLWTLGGRIQNFSEHTKHIGYMDKKSELYAKGVRAGDRIEKLDEKDYKGFKDLLYSSVLKKEMTDVQGKKIFYYRNRDKDFSYTVKNYESPRALFKGQSTIGVLAPAQYLIYNRPEDKENALAALSPMKKSGIEYGDRILWMNGDFVFSLSGMQKTLQDSSYFITLLRKNRKIQVKIPRVKLEDLKISSFDLDEIDDWKYAGKVKGKWTHLDFIPYYFNERGVIESKFSFLEEETEEKIFSSDARNPYSVEIFRGDRIIAVNGEPVNSAVDILKELQKRNLLIVVEKMPAIVPIQWKKADWEFQKINSKKLDLIFSSLGEKNPVRSSGNYRLLSTVTLVRADQMLHDPVFGKEIARYEEEIEKIENSEERKKALAYLNEAKKRWMLGIALQDRKVLYNPSPYTLFKEAFADTGRIFSNLFSGRLNPKWMSGPIGIIQVIQHSWMVGPKEALFWLGLISLNLGILNLLPIPVLDGGHILFSVYEWITKKRIKAKTMEKMIIPFLVLLVLFFLFVSYHDLLRILKRFF